MGAALEIAGLAKRYGGDHPALDGVSLQVAGGEFFTLLGPSGCGKTTLLRCVAGFVRPDAGRILCDGARLDTVAAHARDIGMVFQNYAIFPHLSVLENVAYGLRARRVPAGALARRVNEALELVELTALARRMPGQLSGGQQQRVALARALVVRPRLLLMDEPLSNLDARLRVAMRGEIRRIQRELGITTVYVTHDQEEALAISDRLAVMQGGQVEQVGTPWDVYAQARTLFVARFVGLSNAVEGRVVARSGRRATVEAGDLRLQSDTDVAAARVHAVFRPEAVRLLHGGDAGAGSGEGRVLSREFLGAVLRCQIRTPAGVTIVADLHKPTARDAEKEDAPVRFAVDPADVRLFPVEAGA
jgi:ABC-type Fe3+/spermidine/putrescine transport system ATPase subunit